MAKTNPETQKKEKEKPNPKLEALLKQAGHISADPAEIEKKVEIHAVKAAPEAELENTEE